MSKIELAFNSKHLFKHKLVVCLKLWLMLMLSASLTQWHLSIPKVSNKLIMLHSKKLKLCCKPKPEFKQLEREWRASKEVEVALEEAEVKLEEAEVKLEASQAKVELFKLDEEVEEVVEAQLSLFVVKAQVAVEAQVSKKNVIFSEGYQIQIANVLCAFLIRFLL